MSFNQYSNISSPGASELALGGNREAVSRVFTDVASKAFYSPEIDPYMASIRDGEIFKKVATVGGQVTMHDIVGAGFWDSHCELENLKTASPYTAQPKTFSSKFNGGILPISIEMWNYAFADGNLMQVRDMVDMWAAQGRMGAEKDGFGFTYNRALTENLADGVPMISNVHPTNSGTMDNLTLSAVAGTLDAADIVAAVSKLRFQTMKSGIPGMYQPKVLLVQEEDLAAALTAIESSSVALTGNSGTVNFIKRYGIRVVTSPFYAPLDVATAAPGRTRLAILLSGSHGVFMAEPTPFQMIFKGLDNSNNLAYQYMGFYHMIFGAYDGFGTVGIAI